MANRARDAFEGDTTLVPDTSTPDKDVPRVPQKGTGSDMYGRVFENDEPITEGQTRDLRPPGWDEFSRTDEEKRAMGVKSWESEPFPIRDPAYWQQYEHSNRAQQYTSQVPGARVLRDENGQPFRHGDCVMAVCPRTYQEAAEEQRKRDTAEFDAQTSDDETGEFPEVPRWNATSDSNIREMAQRQHWKNVSSGMIGQYSGMRLEAVIAEVGKEAYLATQAKYRKGGRHQTEVDNEQQQRRLEDARSQAGGGSRFVQGSIPANVKPRNTMAAAAARRG